MAERKRYNTKQLSNHLRELAAEASDVIAEDGDEFRCLTRGEVLAELVFRKALGYTEVRKDDEGNETKVVHPPERWALELIFDRLEGRVPQAITEADTKLKVAERVGEINKNRINALTEKAVAAVPPPVPDPPTFKQEDSDGE